MKRTTLLIAALTFVACTDTAAPPVPVDTDLASAKGGGGTSGGGATALPTWGGGGVAEAINDAGVVVGSASEAQRSRTEPGASYPAKWIRDANGVWVVTRLGEQEGGRALAVNEAGDAVGERSGNAIFWSAAGIESPLGAGRAKGINGAGIIVGESPGGDASAVAYVWVPDAGISPARGQLPLLEVGGRAGAYAINKNSVITGWATRAGLFRAVKWVPIEGGWSEPIPLDGTEPSTGTSAGYSINDNGDVAGYSRSCPSCGSRPYFWPAVGGSVNLASSISNINGGLAWGIANGGHVVGVINVTSGSGGGPFFWNSGTMKLADLGDGEAKDINNGTGQYFQEAVGRSAASRGGNPLVWRVP